MWSNDTRIRDGPGRYEWRNIGASLTIDGATVVIPANPNRVALIIRGAFTLPALGDSVAVGPVVNNVFAPVAAVSPERPTNIVRFCDAGDGIWRGMVAVAVGATGAISASEVVWHPTLGDQ